jgi:YtcA family
MLALIAAPLMLSGCSHSPSFTLLGSYFPSWIVCVAVAGALTALVHALLSGRKLVEELWPLSVLYPALLVFVACTMWLCFFS